MPRNILGQPHRHGVDRLDQRGGERHARRHSSGRSSWATSRPRRSARRRSTEFGREAVLHGGGVDIGLERRAGLAQRPGGAVELALAVVAAADHGAHRAAGLDHHDGAFGDAIFLAVLAQIDIPAIPRPPAGCSCRWWCGDHRAHAGAGGQLLDLLEGPVEEIVGALAGRRGRRCRPDAAAPTAPGPRS